MTAQARATFGVEHPLFDAGQITERLGLTPTRVRERGEPRHRPGGPVRETTLWSLTSPLPDTEELVAHLRWLLDRLEPRAGAVEDLRADGGTVRWWCLLTARANGNLVWLDAPVLARLSAIGGDLLLDLYDGDVDDGEE